MATTTTAGARIDIPVEGMTCAACQASVQKALQRQPGVLDAAVNLMMKNAAVTYDPAVTRPEALVEAIRDTGYEAELPRPERTAFEEQEARDRANEEEFRDPAPEGRRERRGGTPRDDRLDAPHGLRARSTRARWPTRSCAGPWSRSPRPCAPFYPGSTGFRPWSSPMPCSPSRWG